MSKKILVIDDERAIRSALKDILSFEGFEVEEATDGLEGIKKIKEQDYDCILCDIKMPKMDGTEVLDQSLLHKPDIPFRRPPGIKFISVNPKTGLQVTSKDKKSIL